MQTIYTSTPEGKLTPREAICDGSWISLIDPSADEIEAVSSQCGVDRDDLRAALDIEEHSRVTPADGYVLVLVDVPTTQMREGRRRHITIPLGIVIASRAIITVCLQRIPVIAAFETGQVRGVATSMKTRFTLQMLLRAAGSYLSALGEIEKLISRQEESLHRSTRNAELIQMLELEKSLVYINTSLVNNQRVLERLVRTSAVTKYPEDDELLQDAIIENDQAVEMANIYSGILAGTMDAYASVIANNQNAIMKTLALVTIVLSIPTMIFSAYGMNVDLHGMPLAMSGWGFVVVVGFSFAIALVVVVYFIRKKWF